MARDIPIIFSGPMVRALLDNRKDRTRRLASSPLAKVQPADRLWVRECWSDQDCREGEAMYRATACRDGLLPEEKAETRWRPSIHMPRWANRITLIVTETRFQPLQAITPVEMLREGAYRLPGRTIDRFAASLAAGGVEPGVVDTIRDAWIKLWNSLHDKPGQRWEDNPDVVELTFHVVPSNIDAAPAAVAA